MPLVPWLPARGQGRDNTRPRPKLPRPPLVPRAVPGCCYCLLPQSGAPVAACPGRPKPTVEGRGVKGVGRGRLEAELSALWKRGRGERGRGRWPEPPALRHLARRPWRAAPPGRRPRPSPAFPQVPSPPPPRRTFGGDARRRRARRLERECGRAGRASPHHAEVLPSEEQESAQLPPASLRRRGLQPAAGDGAGPDLCR